MFCLFLFVYLFAFFFVFICLLFVFCFALLLNMKARITVLGKPLDVCKFCFLFCLSLRYMPTRLGLLRRVLLLHKSRMHAMAYC